MGIWKNIQASIIAVSALVLIITTSVTAADYTDWLTYTSVTDVRYVDYFDDSLQFVTSGGWVKIDPVSLGMRKLTNVDNLGTADLYDIYKDSSGAVWVAGYGRLIRQYDNQFEPYLFFDRNDDLLTLYSLEDDGDYIWVGTSSGLALFSKSHDEGQIEDFYFRFGDLNPEPAVYDILTVGDTIWLATSSGLAVADKSDPDLLKSFTNWTVFGSGSFPLLAGDTVFSLAYFDNSVYVGTTRSALQLSISGTDTSFTKISIREPAKVRNMIVGGDTLFIYTSAGFYFYSEFENVWSYTPTILSASFSAGRIIDGVHWVGFTTVGIYYGSGTQYSKYDDGGLPSNYVTSLAPGSGGRLIGGFYTRGAAFFENDEWFGPSIIALVEGGTSLGVRSVIMDDEGNGWAGTWGNGLMLMTDDTVYNFDENNSTLHGIDINPQYVVVNSMAISSTYLFMTNYQALDGNVVSVMDLNDYERWNIFGFDDGITNDRLASIDCKDDAFAVGMENAGIFYYYFGQDPFNKSDDTVFNMLEDNTNLGSNNVRVVKFDNDGGLWAGTKFGLSRYNSGIDRFDDIVLPDDFGPIVTSMAFDGRNNVWLGAQNGLAFLNTGTGEFTQYDILNSGLPDNDIKSITIDPQTGDIFIGTLAGLARLSSPIGPPTREVEEVIAFPNPFIIRDGSERLTFNYDGNATVRIFTPNGELVREMSINVLWDGKNERGEDVAAGVYLALISAVGGEVGKCKILLMRE